MNGLNYFKLLKIGFWKKLLKWLFDKAKKCFEKFHWKAGKAKMTDKRKKVSTYLTRSWEKNKIRVKVKWLEEGVKREKKNRNKKLPQFLLKRNILRLIFNFSKSVCWQPINFFLNVAIPMGWIFSILIILFHISNKLSGAQEL